MDIILEARNLSKSYFNKKALKNINFSLENGKVLGLLGPNGSGKTTFIKIALGILRQSSGEILIDGKKPGAYTKSIISYLPDRNHLYKWMKIKDAVEFFNDLYGDFNKARCDELLEFMKLDKNLKVTSLSKGMMEKLNLTLVLSRKAKLYILDEPLAAVDPVAREKILDAIIDSYNGDSSIIITTHLVKDVERIFDDVAFMKDGEIVLTGNAEDLRIERGKSIDEIFREVFQ